MAVTAEWLVFGDMGGSCRPKADIGDVGLRARKLTVVLSSSGCPVWDLELTFLWRSIPSYTVLYQPGPQPARKTAPDPKPSSAYTD